MHLQKHPPFTEDHVQFGTCSQLLWTSKMELLKIAALLVCFCVLGHASGGSSEEVEDCLDCVESIQTLIQYGRTAMANGEIADPARMCDDVPREYQSLCQEVLTSFGGDDGLSLDPRYMAMLCKVLGKCEPGMDSSEEDVTEMEFEASRGADILELGNSVEGLPCLICDNLMRLAQGFLKDKAHQAMVLRLLKGACHFVPFLKSECENLVDRYGSLVLHMASHWLNPELCKLFHICSATNLLSQKDSCRLCEFSVGIIQDSMDDPAIVQRLATALKDWCNTMGNDKQTCRDLSSTVDDLLPGVIKMLKHNVHVEALCQEPGICAKREGEDYID